LKPYFYVLNNLLRATIDPKIGDSTTIQHHAPTILICFGLAKRFSLINLIWRNIQEVSLDPHKSLPYDPYLMYIIEQVSGFSFAYDTNHPDWRIRNLGPHFGKGKDKATEASGSGAVGASDDEGGDAVVAEDAPSPAARRGRGSGHGRGAGGATRHALRWFFSYLCYTQKKTMCAFIALRSRSIFLLRPLFMSFWIHMSSMMLGIGLQLAVSRDMDMMRAMLVRRIFAHRVAIVFLLMIVHLIFQLATLLRIRRCVPPSLRYLALLMRSLGSPL
jgi:hypothetical protein